MHLYRNTRFQVIHHQCSLGAWSERSHAHFLKHEALLREQFVDRLLRAPHHQHCLYRRSLLVVAQEQARHTGHPIGTLLNIDPHRLAVRHHHHGISIGVTETHIPAIAEQRPAIAVVEHLWETSIRQLDEQCPDGKELLAAPQTFEPRRHIIESRGKLGISVHQTMGLFRDIPYGQPTIVRRLRDGQQGHYLCEFFSFSSGV